MDRRCVICWFSVCHGCLSWIVGHIRYGSLLIIAMSLTGVQINLVTGDVFKHASAMFKDLLDDVLEIIKWFNNHTRALGMLKDTMIVKLGKAVCLILPVITRWTLHYLAVRRLIGAECTFLQLLLDREDELVLCAGDKEPVWRKAEEVISKLRQPAFFDRLKWCVMSRF